MNADSERTCIVTREGGSPEGLIRFVAAPDMRVVPDLKRKLPGRGCWVRAERRYVDQAARKNLFARALKVPAVVDGDLGELVDRLLLKSALGALGLSRKAGQAATGAAKVEASVRSGKASLVLHALEAADDGVRKIAQARRAVVYQGGPAIPAFKLFSQAELGLALGAANVIHAALLGSEAGKAARRRVEALARYRGEPLDDRMLDAAVAYSNEAAEDTE